MSSFFQKMKRSSSSAKAGMKAKMDEMEAAKAKLEEEVLKYKGEVESYKTEAEGYKKQAEEVQVKAEEQVKVAKEEVDTVKKEAEKEKTGLMAQVDKYKKMAQDALAKVDVLQEQLAQFTGSGLGNLKEAAGGALSGGLSKLGMP